MTSPRVLIYGDVDMNIIDGSAVWVQSTALALARGGAEVDVLLKRPIETDRLTAPLCAENAIRLRRPFEEEMLPNLSRSLSPNQVGLLVGGPDFAEHDAVLVRGFRVATRLAEEPGLHGRLWVYLTDIPQRFLDLTPEDVGKLERVAAASRFLLCQTEELRSYLEEVVPSAAGRAVVFPPVVVVPDDPFVAPPWDDGPLRLVYLGKFAPLWNTEQMAALPDRLASVGVEAEMHFIGDKVHRDHRDPGFHDRMLAVLRAGRPNVTWHGGMPRLEALQAASAAHVGMSWRDPELDSSLELSTKLLEYGALGLPVVVNRTAPHEQLLGADYPLFAGNQDEVVDVLQAVHRRPGLLGLAAGRTRAAAEDFSMARASERAQALLARAAPRPRIEVGVQPLKVTVASHDLKFFTAIQQHFEAVPEIDVRLDRWSALAEHDEAVSSEMLNWSDVVVCEWLGPNTAWYSSRMRPGQRLVSRLHRFELHGAYPQRVSIQGVDQVVCVSPYYSRLTHERTGWPREKITTIPNYVDDLTMARPKLPGAEFNLGVIGLAPARKRFDLTLDVLERVRKHDPRFRLFVKSKMPWEYPWIWMRPEERQATDAYLRRIASSPLLRDAVVFDGFGPDVGSWLRKIGFVLSTSDDESFHMATIEGAAAGSVPLLLPWDGVDTIYDGRWIHEDVDAMASDIVDSVARGVVPALGRRAQEEILAGYAVDDVTEAWTRVIVEDLPPYDEVLHVGDLSISPTGNSHG